MSRKKDLFFIEDNNFLSFEQKEFINGTVLSPNSFPFYHQRGASTSEDDNSILSHIVKIRPEIREEGEIFNSYTGHVFEDILRTFCKKNNIAIKESLRIAVNFTYNNGAISCPIHLDHEFPHKQLLIYLNEPLDKQAKTVILDKDEKTILKEITPEQYKGVCFNDKPHYHYYPKIGERIVAVFTFR